MTIVEKPVNETKSYTREEKKEIVASILQQLKDVGAGEVHVTRTNNDIFIILVSGLVLNEYFAIKGKVYMEYRDFIDMEHSSVLVKRYYDLMRKYKPIRAF